MASFLTRSIRLMAVALLASGLSACAEIELASHLFKKSGYNDGYQTASQGNFKVGKPYDVEGRTYYPKENYSLDETGIASWYGPGFHGKRTATGERFDENELTAAHRTLQLPSLVRVTNLENGRSLIVRVNDRGPFSKGRIIDVSKKASDLLGFRGKGTARVRVQVLAEESRQMAEAAKRGEDTRGMEIALNNAPPAPQLFDPSVLQEPVPGAYQTASIEPVAAQPLPGAAPTSETVYTPSGVPGHFQDQGRFYPDPVVKQFPVNPTRLYIQAGSFSQPENAEQARGRLSAVGPARVVQVMVNGQNYFRVQVGPMPNVHAADSVLSDVINKGFSEARIMVDSS